MNPDTTCVVFPSGKYIAVDLFKGATSAVYFLSHFHMDHVIGLRDIQHQCKIYCSEVTRQLVLADQSFKAAHPMLAGLPVSTGPHPVPELPGLSVTLVPAGHCLGSVMFLFRDSSDGYTALHTGDFRIPTEPDSLRCLAAFHDTDGQVIPIDNAVVDTTFFTEHCRRLPTREESTREICSLVDDWLHRQSASSGGDQRHHQASASSSSSLSRRPASSGVLLLAKARFSYEYVFETLADTFHTKIHISEQGLRYYGELASNLHFYSTQPDQCSIHLGGCGCDTHRMLTICLSTMYFDKTAGFSQLVVWPAECTARVLFSFHPSMAEVAALLAYLRPRAARALVTPSEDSAAGVQSRLDELLLACRGGADFGSLKRRRRCGSDGFDFAAAAPARQEIKNSSSSSRGGAGGGDDSSSSDDSLCAVPLSLVAKNRRSKVARLS